MHECVMTREAHCPHNTEGVMNNTPDPGDTGPLVVITVTDMCMHSKPAKQTVPAQCTNAGSRGTRRWLWAGSGLTVDTALAVLAPRQ